jgi:hypothetical protein
MEPSERKLLFAFVRQALIHPGDDTFDARGRNQSTVASLRSQGLLQPNEDRLPKQAFLAYFETLQEIQCPPTVQQLLERFGITDFHWRRPSDVIRRRMGQERGISYPLLNTVFIGDRGDQSTWFHELGHLLYPKIESDQARRLAEAARTEFPVVSGDQVLDGADPVTLQPTHLPEGIYIRVNRRYHGLDHSGPGADTENDEIWAVLFAEYCGGFELPPTIRVLLEEIILGLSAE